MDDCVVFQRVSARGYSVHRGKKMDVFLNLPTEETNYPQLRLKWSYWIIQSETKFIPCPNRQTAVKQEVN